MTVKQQSSQREALSFLSTLARYTAGGEVGYMLLVQSVDSS
jgi:hypothetical protein